MWIPEQLSVSLASSIIGGVIVALINHLFTKRKSDAEANKLDAETIKIRTMTFAEVEKLKAETEKCRSEAAKIRVEVEKFNAYIALKAPRVVATVQRGSAAYTLIETAISIRDERVHNEK